MEKLHPNSLSTIYPEKLYQLDTEFRLEQKEVERISKEGTPTKTTPPPETTPTQIPIQGKGTNKILIINADPTSEFINVNDAAFLSKIIAATKNNLEECSLVNAKKNELNIHELISQTNTQKIICFGINPFEIGLKDKNPVKYELSDMDNNASIIPVDSLKEISQNEEKKKAFWFALKRMFNV